MTNKNPVRSCEDVDESVLSYAEIKALCIGDSRIKEKMDLDIQVSKLRVLEGSYKSQQYRLQDRILKHYPQSIESAKERIVGLEKDFERWKIHSEREFGMTVSEKPFGKDEKTTAGEAILEACKGLHGIKTAAKIGEYKGFEMSAHYNFITRQIGLTLKADGISHSIDLGESATGNITRIDNVLEKIPERLASEKTYLEELNKQFVNAKAELERPFEQAEELETKSARLAELDVLLNMDEQEKIKQTEGIDAEGNIPQPGESDAAMAVACDSDGKRHDSVSADKNETPTDSQDKHEVQPDKFTPEIGQRIIFHPDGGTVTLTGKVVAINEKTVTVRAGIKYIPIYKDKGRFELEREPMEKGGNAFER